jgi:hypothetical protein
MIDQGSTVFILCVLIKVDFIRCSYLTKFSAMYLKMDFYIVIISLLDCLTCMHTCSLMHMHTEMKSIPAQGYSLLFCSFHKLLWRYSFVFQGCRRYLGWVSCSYATAANVLWGSKESASYGCTCYVIIAREQGIKEQGVNETPSLCSVLGNTCLEYV